MKVCVFGAGVIGGILASAMARAGHETSLIARGPHLRALQARGLTVETPAGAVTTRHSASDDPKDLGPHDLVVVATKTPALPAVADVIAPLLSPVALVAFAVNGIFWFYGEGFAPGRRPPDVRRLDPDLKLHQKIGVARSIGVVCWGGGELREPGIIEATRAGGRFVFGSATPEGAGRARRLVDGLGVEALTFEHVEEIRRPMWNKYLGVLGNFAVCTLTGSTIAQTRADADVLDLTIALMNEGAAVAKAHGFADLDFDPEKMRGASGHSNHKPSMLQDFERGRVMEIDSTFRVLQDLARQAGIATPALDIVAPLIALKAKTAGCG